jgi:hypothetical protein
MSTRGGLFKRTPQAGRLDNRPKFRYNNLALSLPPFIWRVLVSRHSINSITLTGNSPDIPQGRHQSPLEEVEQLVLTISSRMKEDHEFVSVTIKETIQPIKTSKAKIVSNGSFDKEEIKLGTVAWVISTS